MRDMFEEFGAIVLDSSLLFSQLNDSFFDLLKVYVDNGGALFRYPAFNTEVSELQKAVDESLREVSSSNATRLGELSITDFKDRELNGDCDCESLLCLLLSQDIEVAVVTTNKLLIERLVLNNIQVSLIDPVNHSSLTRPADFATHKANSDVLTLATPSAIPYVSVGEGDRLVCGDGSSIMLTSVFNEGGKEAVIYHCDRSGVVAKIFREGILTDSKLENIRNFINFNKNLPWLICPTDILFTDHVDFNNSLKSSCPVGYLMPKISEVTDVGVEELFLGDIDCFENDKYKQTKPTYVADVCISILRQIIFLHMNGVLFGDFNGGNLAIKNDRSTDYVVFFDTDGYGYKKNPVVSAAAEFENPRTYDLHDKRDLLRSEYDNLCIAVFRWLTLGMLPFAKDENGDWNYRNWQYETEQRKARWALIPTALQKLFNSVFGDGEIRTPTELLFALKNAYKMIVIQPLYCEYFTPLLSSNQPQVIQPVSEPKPIASKPKLKPLTQKPPPPLKANWQYVLLGIATAIAVGLAIWWFGLGHPGYPKAQNAQVIKKSEEPQFGRYETDNGYYFSYTGTLDGYVEFHWKNGDVYKGYYKNGVRTGNGEYEKASGEKQVGDFVEGNLTGNGKIKYLDGTTYEGNFESGVKSGEGTFYDADGNVVYHGSWKSDLFNGQGTYYFPNHASYKDTWSGGTCKGGESVNLTITESGEPAAKGYWRSNIFYGSYYENARWYDLPIAKSKL